MPGLAEAAALGAAARDLDRHAIEDRLGPADRAVVGEGIAVEVVDERALDREAARSGASGAVDDRRSPVSASTRVA